MINKISSINFEARNINRFKPKKVQRVIEKVQTGKSLSGSLNSPLRGEINIPEFESEAWLKGSFAGWFAGAIVELSTTASQSS